MSASLRETLFRAGFNADKLPRHLVVGRFYRLPAPGKPKSDTSGWVKLFADGVAIYGAWSSNEPTRTWRDGDRERPAHSVITDNRRQREAEQAEQYERAARTVASIWKQAQPADDHPYLRRKKAAAYGLRVDRQRRLLVPVRDAVTGELISLQYIAADGSKLFATGGRTSNGCHIIPGNLPRIFCEGYATGATIHAATGRAVIVCFSAGNLKTVAATLAEPGDVVAADNDNAVKPGEKLGKSVKDYGTGHKAAIATSLPFYMPAQPGADFNDLGAEQTAATLAARPLNELPVLDAWKLERVELNGTTREQWLKQLGREIDPQKAAALAYSVASRLFMTAPVQISLQGIRQAIEAAIAPQTIHPATLDRIMERLEKAMQHRQARSQEAVSIPADVLARHRHEVVDELPKLAETEYSGVIVAHAPMGSGKTQHVGAPFMQYGRTQSRALALCHRVSLTHSMAKHLGTEHYNAVDAETAPYIDALTTCLPSITLAAHRQIIDNAGYIFIDEISQVLRFLAADSHCRTKEATNEQVYDRLRQIVASARCVIVADAGVDRRTLEFLEDCRPSEQFRIIEMRRRKGGIEARYHAGGSAPDTVIGACLAELEAGGAVWIATESKGRTRALEKLFTGQGFRVLAVHSDNKGNAAQATFLANVEAESRKYDVVIASPVIGSGISVEHRDGEHFTLGAYIGGGHSITPADAAQMLRRVRYLRRFELALIPNNQVGNQSPDGILTAQRAAAAVENTAARENGFSWLKASVEADDQNQRADFAAGLLWQLERANWTLTRGEGNEDAGDVLKVAREQAEAEYRAALLAAPVLTEQEAKQLESLTSRTSIQNELLEAHRIRQALGVNTLDEDALDFWDDGRALRRLDRFSAFRGTVSAFNDQAENIARRKFRRATAKAYSKLFAGIEIAAERITEDIAETILERVLAHRHLLAYLGIVPAKFGAWLEDKKGNLLPFLKPKNPRQELAAILELMGLEWKRREGTATLTPAQTGLDNLPKGEGKTAGKKGGKPPRQYFYVVTPESVAQMALWAERRNAVRQVVKAEPVQVEGWPEPPRLPANIDVIMADAHEAAAVEYFASFDDGQDFEPVIDEADCPPWPEPDAKTRELWVMEAFALEPWQASIAA